MTLATLATFFGWMAVIHLVVLSFAAVVIYALGDWATALHARMFGLSQDATRQTFYNWLALYKLLIFVFALVPWLALKFM
ncbi:hypothetical protein shim_00910 [Shimia sp. SK013]|uniref:DUF6868 family protein n=1 Tax=Shimia sp. SK013 TaxID=1389006 RepID=UPI0006B4D1F1|nr:hypothetical protein [Shimia sp. SK013]KPA23483.1 hypothetical protein shim_00910 [Shimia sp. SK013]